MIELKACRLRYVIAAVSALNQAVIEWPLVYEGPSPIDVVLSTDQLNDFFDLVRAQTHLPEVKKIINQLEDNVLNTKEAIYEHRLQYPDQRVERPEIAPPTHSA